MFICRTAEFDLLRLFQVNFLRQWRYNSPFNYSWIKAICSRMQPMATIQSPGIWNSTHSMDSWWRASRLQTRHQVCATHSFQVWGRGFHRLCVIFHCTDFPIQWPISHCQWCLRSWSYKFASRKEKWLTIFLYYKSGKWTDAAIFWLFCNFTSQIRSLFDQPVCEYKNN